MNMTETVEVSGKLVDLLSRQRYLYEQLRDLTQRQTELIGGADPQMLLKILAERQRLIDKLTVISRELAPIREDWQQVSAGLTVVQREEVQRLIGQTQVFLNEIMRRDKEDAEKLSGARQEVAGEIRHFNNGRKAQHVYARQYNRPQNGGLDINSR